MLMYHHHGISVTGNKLYRNTPISAMRRIMAAFLFLFVFFAAGLHVVWGQEKNPSIRYVVSMPNPSSHYYHVELFVRDWREDSVILKMPQWTPGYYQLLHYANAVEHVSIVSDRGTARAAEKIYDNAWIVRGVKNRPFTLRYDVRADKNFVAQSVLDSVHGYIVPASLFLYADKHLNLPVTIKLNTPTGWTIVTGLANGKTSQEFTAPDFDILYDSPILFGTLDVLPSFKVRGVEHRFIGYATGNFNRAEFMGNLNKVVSAAVDVIDDIPFTQYTFIGIGPGRGGIEHLNNTTVSFDGSQLGTPAGMNGMLNFLAHEYFHHYNVKRIRPLELGPFDYDRGSKTNLLWVSEGLTVYYEYLVVKRAGLATEPMFFANFEQMITALENNPGRAFQSLKQASYETWSDGPFGKQGKDADKSISYYVKGPVVGLLLDFAIRNATANKQSLDDVMRYLYQRYYKTLGRGFTDGEFEQACETIAGASLSPLFEYVYTTKDLDYDTYLRYGGLQLAATDIPAEKPKRKFTLRKLENMTPLQAAIFKSWAGE